MVYIFMDDRDDLDDLNLFSEAIYFTMIAHQVIIRLTLLQGLHLLEAIFYDLPPSPQNPVAYCLSLTSLTAQACAQE